LNSEINGTSFEHDTLDLQCQYKNLPIYCFVGAAEIRCTNLLFNFRNV
jgi:hypothetical protein